MSPRRALPPALYRKFPFLQEVLDGMPASVKVVDSKFHVVYANRQALGEAQRDLNSLRGRSCHSCLNGFYENCPWCPVVKTFEDGESHVSYFKRHGDGPETEMEVTGYLLSAGGGERYAVEITRDVTSLASGQALPRKAGDLFRSAPAFVQAYDHAMRAGQGDWPVLLWGERGSGKKTLARILHQRSKRATGTFLQAAEAGDAGTVGPEKLFGAGGPWDLAKGGTLYLGDLTRLSLPAQQVLATRITLPADDVSPRVIASSTEDPARLMKEGSIAGGLYHAFAARILTLPPLREQKKDLASLARQILDTQARRTSRPPRQLAPSAVRQLLVHDWPGNLAELEDVLERSSQTAGETLESLDLPAPPSVPGRLSEAVGVAEKAFLSGALLLRGGDMRSAAKDAGMSVKTLQRRLRLYHLDARDFKRLG